MFATLDKVKPNERERERERERGGRIERESYYWQHSEACDSLNG